MLLSKENQRVRRELTGERLRQFDTMRKFELIIAVAVGVFGLVVLVVLPLLQIDIHKSRLLNMALAFVLAAIVGTCVYSLRYRQSSASLLLEEREASEQKHD